MLYFFVWWKLPQYRFQGHWLSKSSCKNFFPFQKCSVESWCHLFFLMYEAFLEYQFLRQKQYSGCTVDCEYYRLSHLPTSEMVKEGSVWLAFFLIFIYINISRKILVQLAVFSKPFLIWKKSLEFSFLSQKAP